MASITKKELKSGIRYLAQVRRVGYPPVSKFGFRRKADAVAWAAKIESQMLCGQYNPTGHHTVAELVQAYVADEIGHLVASEQKNRRRQLEWWAKNYGAMELRHLTPAVIAQGRRLLLTGGAPSGRAISDATANRYLAALSAACAVAHREWGWLENNPCAAVKRRRESRGRTRFLSEEEQARLLAIVRDCEDPILESLVVLAMTSGARRGELLALRWPDVDLGSRKAVLHHTKNREIRTIPLAAPAVEQLQKLQAVRRIDDDRVFLSLQGKCRFPEQAWRRVRDAAGLEGFRFHDLRHTAASYLAMSGATLQEIAEILGHKTLAMVKRYSHLTEQHSLAVVDRMVEKFYRG